MNNIIIKPESISFSELVKTNTLSLSLNAQSDMIDLLNSEFNQEQVKRYILNVYMFLYFDPTTDFPVDLEYIYKDLGFANKGNAMKTIKSNFTIEEDYKISLVPKEKSSWGGSGTDKVMLNIDTYKMLCMLVKTPQGKEIRKYYVKLENIYNNIIKKEIENKDKLLEENKQELEYTKKALQKISKLKTKKWYDTEAGDILYGVISNTEDANSIIKLGKAKNGTNREGNYFTHNQTGEMFYIRKCYNCYLAEKVLFHILDKYRIHNNKEWFNISKDLAIYSIDIVCNFLDNFINYSEVLLESNLLENLKNSLDIVKNLSDDDKIIYNKDEININKNDNIIKTKNTIKKIEKPKEDVYDFHKFFKENCEIGIDFECSTYDIYGAYRLWSKIVRVENKNKFTEFLNINYKKKRKFFKDIKTSMSIYIGFKVKPFQILQENLNILPKYEEFILTNCDFAYNNKTSVENLIEEWNDWIKDYQDYDYNVLEERQFKSYINRHFLKTNMKIPSENGSIECNGIWGLKLKKIDLILSKNHKSTSKKILKIDVKTQQILEEYDSIMMLYDILKTSRRTIHTYIQLKTIFDEKYMYKFKEEI